MRLILLGLPGAGKGTQAKLIAQRHGLLHVSTGDMFREAAAHGTALGKRAQGYMSRGELVPNEVTIGMLLKRIARDDAEPGFMLDGFPRTIAQAEALDVALAEHGGAIDIVLYIEVPEDELIARLSGRWTCPDCGAIYHEQANPPDHAGHCNDCGGELVQREDDRPQTVRQRLSANREWTAALVEFYELAGRLHAVDGRGAPSEVTERLLSVLDGVSVSVRKA